MLLCRSLLPKSWFLARSNETVNYCITAMPTNRKTEMKIFKYVNFLLSATVTGLAKFLSWKFSRTV